MLGQVGGGPFFHFRKMWSRKESMMTLRVIQRNTNLHFLACRQANIKHSELCYNLEIKYLTIKQGEMSVCSKQR